MLKHCAVVAIARHFCTAEGLVCPVFFFFFWVNISWQTETKARFKMASQAIKACQSITTPEFYLGYTRPPALGL